MPTQANGLEFSVVKNLAEAEMNHHHRKILHSFFAHPMSANIAMKDVESVFRELGANIKSAHSGKMHVTLNGHNMNFTHASHSLHKEEVHQVKKILGLSQITEIRGYHGSHAQEPSEQI